MPITRKQFELEIDPKTEEQMKPIESFLSSHKNDAFGREELWEALRGKGEEREAWDAALDKLVELGVVEKRIIRGADYYSCKKKDNVAPSITLP